MRRTIRFLALLLLGAAAVAVPATGAAAQPSGAAVAAAAASAGADFDNDGFADLAVGVPDRRVAGAASAGSVGVLYGSNGGLSTAGGQLITQVGGTVESDDQFGAEVSSGDFDNDGIADLAAGAPAEDVGGQFNAGAVSAGGRLFTQNSPGVPGTAEAFDSFGGNSFNAG